LIIKPGTNPHVFKRLFELQHQALIHEPGIKTIGFGLKPGNCLFFNCPDLKVGAINDLDNLGFSPLE
jgi:hypothetical protein